MWAMSTREWRDVVYRLLQKPQNRSALTRNQQLNLSAAQYWWYREELLKYRVACNECGDGLRARYCSRAPRGRPHAPAIRPLGTIDEASLTCFAHKGDVKFLTPSLLLSYVFGVKSSAFRPELCLMPTLRDVEVGNISFKPILFHLFLLPSRLVFLK